MAMNFPASTTVNKSKLIAWLPWALVIVMAGLLLVASWQPLKRMANDLFANRDGTTTTTTAADGEHASPVTVSVTPGGGSSGGSTRTVTVNIPTNTTGNSGTSGGGGDTGGGDGTPPPQTGGNDSNNPLNGFYTNIGTGQTKGQLISMAGSDPDGCTTVDVLLLGTQQICTWASKDGTVAVTMLNGQVVSKQLLGL